MDRRKLLKLLAVAGATLTVPLTALGVDQNGSKVRAQSSISSAPFKNILLVECNVVDMVNGTERRIAIEDTRPVSITEGKKPFSISIAESDSDYLAMTFFDLIDDRLVAGKTLYVGKNGLQVLKDRGVVLQFSTHES